MPKQNQAVEAKSDKKSWPKVKPTVVEEWTDDLAGLAKLPGGPIAAIGDGTIQAARLGDPRLQTAQRQALAAQIGRVQGNQHLQRVVASLKTYERTAHPIPARRQVPGYQSGQRSLTPASPPIVQQNEGRVQAHVIQLTAMDDVQEALGEGDPNDRALLLEEIFSHLERYVENLEEAQRLSVALHTPNHPLSQHFRTRVPGECQDYLLDILEEGISALEFEAEFLPEEAAPEAPPEVEAEAPSPSTPESQRRPPSPEQRRQAEELLEELRQLEEVLRTRYPEGPPSSEAGILEAYAPGEATARNLDWWMEDTDENIIWTLTRHIIFSPIVVPFLVYEGLLEDTIMFWVDIARGTRRTRAEYSRLRRRVQELRERTASEGAEGGERSAASSQE